MTKELAGAKAGLAETGYEPSVIPSRLAISS